MILMRVREEPTNDIQFAFGLKLAKEGVKTVAFAEGEVTAVDDEESAIGKVEDVGHTAVDTAVVKVDLIERGGILFFAARNVLR